MYSAATLQILEVPDCHCATAKPRPVCVAGNRPCLDYRQRGHCDCPTALPPPCPHILAASHDDLTLSQWAALLAKFIPEEYYEPPPEPPYLDPAGNVVPKLVKSREHYVKRMARRRRMGLALRAWWDLTESATDKLGAQIAKHQNGESYQSSLRHSCETWTAPLSPKERKQATPLTYKHPWWDEYAEIRLRFVNAVLERLQSTNKGVKDGY